MSIALCVCMNCIASFLQESYSLLAKFGIQVTREEADKVDTFRYSWQKLLSLSVIAFCVSVTGIISHLYIM